MAKRGFWTGMLTLGIKALIDSRGTERRSRRRAGPTVRSDDDRAPIGGSGSAATIEVAPDAVRGLLLEYSPMKDGDPDAGEIVWTWVPYAENDGRGKDRPVLVIARQSAERLYAVKLTSKDKPGRDDRLSIGSGAWDSSGRASWVDTDQLYSVHRDSMRREAAALDLDRFTRVASALQHAYGWTTR